MRWLWTATAVILASSILYLTASLVGALLPGEQRGDVAGDPGESLAVRLLSGPLHYDLLIPMTDGTRAQFADLRAMGVPLEASEAEWLMVGWGSEAFYTTVGGYSDLTAAAIWRAVTGDEAVLRVDVLGPLPDGLPTQEVPLTAAGAQALLAAVSDTLARTQTGTPTLLLSPKPGRGGWFFAARGRFHLFRTCNVWIGRMLRAGGVPFGIWTPTPYAVRLSHAWHHR